MYQAHRLLNLGSPAKGFCTWKIIKNMQSRLPFPTEGHSLRGVRVLIGNKLVKLKLMRKRELFKIWHVPCLQISSYLNVFWDELSLHLHSEFTKQFKYAKWFCCICWLEKKWICSVLFYFFIVKEYYRCIQWECICMNAHIRIQLQIYPSTAFCD